MQTGFKKFLLGKALITKLTVKEALEPMPLLAGKSSSWLRKIAIQFQIT